MLLSEWFHQMTGVISRVNLTKTSMLIKSRPIDCTPPSSVALASFKMATISALTLLTTYHSCEAGEEVGKFTTSVELCNVPDPLFQLAK